TKRFSLASPPLQSGFQLRPEPTNGEKPTALRELSQETICPLCLDFFKQPMSLSCGHNFCRDCLAQLGAEVSCPQCRAKVEPSSACPNRALANMVCLVKRLQGKLWTLLEKNASVRQIVDIYVTLNGSTAHPQLWCQGSSVTWANRYQDCPDVPGRFDQEFCVLGSEGFTTGWHWWEVSVQGPYNFPVRGRACWAIGVAKESIRRKGRFCLHPQEGIWAVGKSNYETVAFGEVKKEYLGFQAPLQRLWVRLDCEAKEVQFLDAEMQDSLYTFQMGPFLGEGRETLRPFFYLGRMGVTLQCEKYPSKLRANTTPNHHNVA
uniref:Uncharacterized protein n=1 Tax=Naja naja TaxID=35670 RepID=A0A8C6VCQ2_NAJNA